MEEILEIPSFRVKEPLKLDTSQFATTGRNSFLYAITDCSNQSDLSHLEAVGFQVIETNVTLKQEMRCELKIEPHQNNGYQIRLASISDRKDVEEIARQSFIFDRFHKDPKFSSAKADKIKKHWSSNFFLGKRGDTMVVASENNRAVAFLLLLHGITENVIDLIAVDSNHRNNGLAMQMIDFVKRVDITQKKLLVGTQASNIPSLRMYEKMGFKVINSQFVHHYHGPFINVDS